MKDELSLTVSIWGFIKIKILPKKPKKYKLNKYTLKKIAKRDLKAEKAKAKKAEKAKQKEAQKAKKKAAEKKLTPEEKKAIKAEKKASRPAIPDMISLFAGILKLFFSTFLAHFHFHITRIRIKVGTPDAAQTALMYTGICAVLKPVLIFLDRHSNLHGMKRADIYLEPDFIHEKMDIDVKVAFSMNLFGLFCVLFKVGFKFLFGWIKIKPNTEKNQDKPNNEDKNKGKSDNKEITKPIPET